MEVLIDFFKDHIIVYSLTLPRLISIFAMLAFLSAHTLGGTLTRNGILLSLALILYPVVYAEIEVINSLSQSMLLFIIIKEIFIGVTMGFIVALMFWAIEAVGFFIDNQRGATMASSMDPLTGDQASPMGNFLINTIIAVFFVTGLFLIFMEGIYESYRVWPVSSFFPNLNVDIVFFMLKQFGQIVLLAVLLGAPVIIAMFAAEFGLMLIGRFAPQLNIFFMSMSIKSAVSNFILVVFLATIIAYFGDKLATIPDIYADLNTVWSKQ